MPSAVAGRPRAQVGGLAAELLFTMWVGNYLVKLAVACSLLLSLGAWGNARAQAALHLDATAALDIWPAVTLLRDPGGSLTLNQVLARRAAFAPPEGTPGNLGRTADAVWLRLPLTVMDGRGARRVLAFDYPSLNRIDVYQLEGGVVRGTWRLGNELPADLRPLPSRSHAVELQLPPGATELFVRVQTSSTMVLPISLRTPQAHVAHESLAHLLQGVFVGVGLCMLLYSLAHWASLRDPMFLSYALLLAGNMVFMLSYFGIGAQYLWPQLPGLSLQVAPLGVLVAVAAATAFMNVSLRVRQASLIAGRALQVIRAGALLGVLAAITGLIDYRATQTLATVLGIAIMLVAVPVASARVRQGEAAPRYMLLGWAFYALGAAVMAGLLRGVLAPNFWTLYLYPMTSLIEMAAWMAVLGLHVQTIHRTADRARLESEAQRTLAHTDALTGLPNRRGLQAQLTAALQEATPSRQLALYLLDLDGFKLVNDRYGHDVGDALLVAVGLRLQQQLRTNDVVARLGGDEFVVMVRGLADEGAARAVGQKMLAAFAQPFSVGGKVCEVGLTIGYALAPLDAAQGDELLKRADAAMYAGKQAGRLQLRRGLPAAAPLQSQAAQPAVG